MKPVDIADRLLKAMNDFTCWDRPAEGTYRLQVAPYTVAVAKAGSGFAWSVNHEREGTVKAGLCRESALDAKREAVLLAMHHLNESVPAIL